MPTADATLLPPPYSPTSTVHGDGGDQQERESVRRLDEVGVEAVLGAMIEQKRRASQPSYPAFDSQAHELAGGSSDRDEAPADSDDDGPATHRAPMRSEVFLKAR